jgi:hypothetical protein
VSKHNYEIQVFRPSVLKKDFAPNFPLVRSEGRLLCDNTAPHCDWSKYDAPAWQRMNRPNPLRDRSVPEFLKAS